MYVEIKRLIVGAQLAKPVQVPAPSDDTVKVEKAPSVEEVSA